MTRLRYERTQNRYERRGAQAVHVNDRGHGLVVTVPGVMLLPIEETCERRAQALSSSAAPSKAFQWPPWENSAELAATNCASVGPTNAESTVERSSSPRNRLNRTYGATFPSLM